MYWIETRCWRKCQVTKCSSWFEEIFWILERFLGCKLFSIIMLFADLWIKPGFKLFFPSDKLFKSDLSERHRFLIFFRICKIFLDCSFTAFVGFCFYRSSNHRLNCWGYRNVFVLCGWNWLIFSVSCITLCLKARSDLSDSGVFISIAINWYVTLLYSLFYCTDGESKMIYKADFAFKLLAAIRRESERKKAFYDEITYRLETQRR